MAIHPYGEPLIQRLLIALGLEPNETVKVVIEISTDDVVKVYAVLHPNHDDLKRVCEAFETIPVHSVIVDDQANITTTPRERR